MVWCKASSGKCAQHSGFVNPFPRWESGRAAQRWRVCHGVRVRRKAAQYRHNWCHSLSAKVGESTSPLVRQVIEEHGGLYLTRAPYLRKPLFTCDRFRLARPNDTFGSVTAPLRYPVVLHPLFSSLMNSFWPFVSSSLQLVCQLTVGVAVPVTGISMHLPLSLNLIYTISRPTRLMAVAVSGFLILPSFISIPENDAGQWMSILRVDSALLVDVVSCHWAIPIHGELEVPELSTGEWCRPLTTIGVRFQDVGILLSTDDNRRERITPMSDSVGKFIFAIDEQDR